MIPFLLKEKLELIYGKEFALPDRIDKLQPSKQAFRGAEHDLQKSFFEWLAKFLINDPYLYLMHAIPNGGTRDKITAGMLKAEGVKSGIPDVFLPIPRRVYNKGDGGWFDYHGLYIEFKTKTNKPSEDQRIVMLMLDSQGYKVVCVNTLEDAINEYSYYMVS